jgi:hypothetical protein
MSVVSPFIFKLDIKGEIKKGIRINRNKKKEIGGDEIVI